MKSNYNKAGKGLRLSKSEASEYGKRAAVSAKRRAEQWCIEGEYVTAAQMAERVGVTVDTVHGRLSNAKQMEGAVTWERLRMVSGVKK